MRAIGWMGRVGGLAVLALMQSAVLYGQSPSSIVTVQRGHSAMVRNGQDLMRVAVADAAIAEAVVVSPREILVNGKAPGSTTLAVWDRVGGSRLYEVEVTVDTSPLEEQLRTLFPNDRINVKSVGGTVLLTGNVRDSLVGRRAVELARALGAPVQSNFLGSAATARQILLQVRFGEVTRTGLHELSSTINVTNPDRLEGVLDRGAETSSATGIARLFFLGAGAQLDFILNNLRTRGLFESLAEPNLVALDGQEASFLAGGEFPFPVIQGNGANAAITVVWKEFGVRLNFRPTVTGAGTIRLRVAPEVSSLDFANGLRIQGTAIPTVLSRKAETEVELAPGQHLGIAGLLNNSIRDQASKIPGLGDIPIIGNLFRSRDRREEQTELLVIVTPIFVDPTNIAPGVPGGEPGTWKWKQLPAPKDSTVKAGMTGKRNN